MSDNVKYKLDTINKAQITAVARKALIAADSYYHAWPTQQQENFQATMDENARHRVTRVPLNSLLNIQCSIDEIGEVWSDAPLSKLNILNWASLLTKHKTIK